MLSAVICCCFVDILTEASTEAAEEIQLSFELFLNLKRQNESENGHETIRCRQLT